MPSNPVPNLSQSKLKQLYKLLKEYEKYIKAEQPLAAEAIHMVAYWVFGDIEGDFRG